MLKCVVVSSRLADLYRVVGRDDGKELKHGRSGAFAIPTRTPPRVALPNAPVSVSHFDLDDRYCGS
jgi:hypothetical protein